MTNQICWGLILRRTVSSSVPHSRHEVWWLSAICRYKVLFGLCVSPGIPKCSWHVLGIIIKPFPAFCQTIFFSIKWLQCFSCLKIICLLRHFLQKYDLHHKVHLCDTIAKLFSKWMSQNTWGCNDDIFYYLVICWLFSVFGPLDVREFRKMLVIISLTNGRAC